MKIKIEGNSLGGSNNKLYISNSPQLALHIHQDSQAPINVPLNINNITVKNHLVSIGKSKKIKVVEHFFSALYGLNLFHVKIDFYGNEMPFFDGSSQVFVKSLLKIKSMKSNNSLRINSSIHVKERNSYIKYEPFPKNRLVIDMELSHPYINTQKIILNINKKNYIREIAPARTFIFTNEDDPRLKNLPPYGVGITKKRIYCATPLRFSNELVRHKVLDLLGDLYVLQKRLVGKITGKNTSHQLNLKFIKKLTKEKNKL